MIPTQALRCSVAYSLIVCYIFAVTCHALVITAPTSDSHGIQTAKEKAFAKTKIERLDLDIRIRSTNDGDIKEIAEMLTYALLEADVSEPGDAKHNKQQFLSPLNFKFRNTRSGVTPLLQSRMNAIKIGRKIMHDQSVKGSMESLTEAERLRMLWSNDIFRNSVAKAASLSNEPHIWKDHNFVCAPQSFNWLFHKMVTAENTLTGEVIGFCEIAMLAQSQVGDSSDSTTYRTGSSFFDEECSLLDEEPGVPTIVNLVTSAEYRRRGVGSTVMNSAMNYLRKSSSILNEMALYVEDDNDSAIKMYEKLGFQKRHKIESKKQWYMIRQIPSGWRDEQSIPKVKAFSIVTTPFFATETLKSE